MIGHNCGMQYRWLALALVLLLPAGCAPKDAPPSLPSTPSAPPAAKNLLPDAAEKPAASPLVDGFGLPLVISIEVPEVPPEIQGPSPPIKKESQGGAKPWYVW
jgi:hypothetical protein